MMEATITMQGIANLAGVARTTVSMWRQRYPETADAPFPRPLPTSGAQPLFNPAEVGQWLVHTGHGHNADAVEDALFHSSLFDFVLSQPVRAASILEQWDEGEHESSELGQAVALLVEAAFGPQPVLDRLHDRLWLKHPEKLHDAAISVLTQALSAIIDAHPTEVAFHPTVVPWGPGAMQLAAALTRNYGEDVPFGVGRLLETGDTLADDAALSVIGSRAALCTSPVFPSDAIVLGVWLGITSERAQPFFEKLERILDGLDPRAAAIIIAPAELLLDQGAAAPARKSFLSDTEKGYVAPLRYSARLPRSWAVNLGQRQLAMWILKRPITSERASFPVVVAELAGLSEANHRELISDIATVALSADEMGKHTFFNARHTSSTAAWRDGKLSLDSWTVENAAPRRVVGDLLALADTAGLPLLDEFEFQDGDTENPTLERISWKQATTGKSRVLDVLSGARIPDEELRATGEGTVAVIAAQELTGQSSIGLRRIDRIRLEQVSSNAKLTEPGDVVFLKAKKPLAFIDRQGGHVVQAPVQIARCRMHFGRSHRKLDKVTTPFFVAKAISSATSSDNASWLVAIFDQARLPVLDSVHRLAAHRRDELMAQLEALDKLESGLATGLATDGIRAGPK